VAFRHIVALVVSLLAAACAPAVDPVTLTARPPAGGVFVQGAGGVRVVVAASDVRSSGRDGIALTRNGEATGRTAPVAPPGLAALAGKSAEAGLAERGFQLAAGGVFLQVDVEAADSDFRSGLLLGEATGRVRLTARVLNAKGRLFHSAGYAGDFVVPDVAALAGGGVRQAVDGALSRALGRMLADPELIQAMIQAGRPAGSA
jgi:hypothetical protein